MNQSRLVGFLTNPCKLESLMVTVQPDQIEGSTIKRLEVLRQRIGLMGKGVSKEVLDPIDQSTLVEVHSSKITPNVDSGEFDGDVNATKDVVKDRKSDIGLGIHHGRVSNDRRCDQSKR